MSTPQDEVCEEHSLWSSIKQHFRQVRLNRKKNRKIRKLLREYNISLGDHGKDLVLGNFITEGGQAEIYEAVWVDKCTGRRDGARSTLVFKVFKSTFDLRRDCPLQILRRGNQGHFTAMCHGATLLRDGRFAFVFDRYWGSLDKLIEERRMLNPNAPLFFLLDAIRLLLEIARGMRNLHMKRLLHRDIKPANVLVDCREDDDIVSEPRPLLSLNIGDYESSKLVKGTAFWRSPEVLRYLSAGGDPNVVFTEKTDVYAYGMTCFEVLTGCKPLAHLSKKDYDAVLIHEQQPALPSHVQPWITALLANCWHTNPAQRPSFTKSKTLLSATVFSSFGYLSRGSKILRASALLHAEHACQSNWLGCSVWRALILDVPMRASSIAIGKHKRGEFEVSASTPKSRTVKACFWVGNRG